jgi:hypothetical protein
MKICAFEITFGEMYVYYVFSYITHLLLDSFQTTSKLEKELVTLLLKK